MSGQILRKSLASGKSVFVGLNNKMTFVDANSFRLWGFVVGKKSKEKRLWHIGYYGFTGNLAKENALLISQKFDYVGCTVFQDLVSFNNIDLMIPIAVGFGKTDQIDLQNKKTVKPIIPIEGGIDVQWMLFPWLGCKLGFGLRLNLLNEFSQYSGPYYSTGLVFKPKYL